MSEYQGKVVVQNLTGATISNVVAMHSTKYWPQGVVQAPSLDNGETSDAALVTTSTAETDYWTVSFLAGSGWLIVGSTDEGFESEDNGGVVTLKLYANYFVVQMPASGASGNESYNTSK